MNVDDANHIVIPIRFASIQTAVMSGIGGAVRMPMYSVVKKCTTDVPYCVANEWICGELGRFLRLPIPPFCIIECGKPVEFWFASLDASTSGETLPPADFGRCASKLPSFATGMMLFDIFIMNPDRHQQNFSVDYKAIPAPKPLLFDHGHALFGHVAGEGVKRLRTQQDTLGLDGSPHGIMPVLTTDNFMGAWMKKITAIPNFFIQGVCNEAQKMGISKNEASVAASTLLFRRDNLLTILRQHKNDMAALQTSLFSSFSNPSYGKRVGDKQ